MTPEKRLDLLKRGADIVVAARTRTDVTAADLYIVSMLALILEAVVGE